jgi:hypothetical protein
MLDSPEDVYPGQTRLEYPATSVLFSKMPVTAVRTAVCTGRRDRRCRKYVFNQHTGMRS